MIAAFRRGAGSQTTPRRTGRGVRAFSFGVFLFIAGCASAPSPPEVAENGASLWRRIETDHFVVETNASGTRVKQVARDFETLWHAFASSPVLGMQPPERKLLVVYLNDRGQFSYLAGKRKAGLFYQDSLLGPLIVLPRK